MRIGMLSADWGDYQVSSPGGCTWIRFFGPGAELNANGYETVIGEMGWVEGEGFVAVPTVDRLFAPNRGPIQNPKKYDGGLDVVILKLWMWHEGNEYIAKAQALGQTVIIDIDDWFHGLPTTNIAFQTTHPDRDATWNRNHMLGTYRNVNGLICSTELTSKLVIPVTRVNSNPGIGVVATTSVPITYQFLLTNVTVCQAIKPV